MTKKKKKKEKSTHSSDPGVKLNNTKETRNGQKSTSRRKLQKVKQQTIY